jgi:hypothetical protein
MSVLFLTDVAYRLGPLLSAVSGTHLTALMGILLMSMN